MYTLQTLKTPLGIETFQRSRLKRSHVWHMHDTTCLTNMLRALRTGRNSKTNYTQKKHQVGKDCQVMGNSSIDEAQRNSFRPAVA